MSLHRKNPRRDDNEGPIVAALRAVGADVRPASSKTLPDLVVGFRGATYLLGVKAPPGPRGGDRARRKSKPTGDERPTNWPGGPWVIVTRPTEALAAIGATLNDSTRAGLGLELTPRPAWLVPTAHAVQPTPGPAPERQTGRRRLLKPEPLLCPNTPVRTRRGDCPCCADPDAERGRPA